MATGCFVSTGRSLESAIERDAGASSPCIGPISKTDFEATLRAGIGA
jgi:hypothetical protein